MRKLFSNTFENKGQICTVNAYPGLVHFEERTYPLQGLECREIKPERSKLGAAIKKRISQIGIKEGNTVLYLGASHGYTPSFVSDIVGKHGTVFCLDIAPQVVRDLYFVCQKRENMIPLLVDCANPDTYSHIVPQCDIIYQDIAQRNQVEIFLKNIMFLKEGGFGLLAIKARSIDVTKKPKKIFAEVRQLLEKKVKIVDYRELDPFEKDHAFFVVK